MKNSRKNLPILCLLASVIALSCAGNPAPRKTPWETGAWSGGTTVETKYGFLQGERDESRTVTWKGIPYARPPVGSLRWKAPRAPEAWDGVRKSIDFGPVALQKIPLAGVVGNEDCLYLNVWRPDDERRYLPVVVFLHGGGNTNGTPNIPELSGKDLASGAGVVYISVAYRLGPLGWFKSGAHDESADPEDSSGNYGTLDIIMALRWVRDNVEAFGGDPGRVTVMGESAGAYNVLTLMLSPLAKGLFHGAVAMSGYRAMPTTEEAEGRGRALSVLALVDAGLASDASEAQRALAGRPGIADTLRSLHPGHFAKWLAPSPLGLGMSEWPAVYPDGHVIVEEGFGAFSRGTQPVKVPLIVGTTKDEYRVFMAAGPDSELPAGRYLALARAKSEAWRLNGADAIADAISSVPGAPPVYSYRFDWGSPDDRGVSPLPRDLGTRLGAYHSLDIPFFLGTMTTATSLLFGPVFDAENEAGRLSLSRAIVSYLAAFAASGSPNRDNDGTLPEWKPWAKGSPWAITLDSKSDAPRFGMLSASLTPETIRRLAFESVPPDRVSLVLSAIRGTRLE